MALEDKYTILDKVGEGGNGVVSKVQSKETNQVNIAKTLKSKKPNKDNKIERFRLEIKTLKKLKDHNIEGTIPLLDYSDPEQSENDLWYVMPEAESSWDCLNRDDKHTEDIIDMFIDLSETLIKVHDLEISHRDIKPKNILVYKNRLVFSDFGLAKDEEVNEDYTETSNRDSKNLGAKFTMAPEMRREPGKADAKKADVYSMAKTLWMFLMGNEHGFDGPYDFKDPKISLNAKYKKKHLVELHELLMWATNNDPDKRPTMKEFTDLLVEWKKVVNNFELIQSSEWKFISKQLFVGDAPTEASWSDPKAIINVLNTASSVPNLNHMLFPSGGGQDFNRATKAVQSDWIKLYNNSNQCYLVKPKRLYLTTFVQQSDWNYFFLETVLDKAIYKDNEFGYEPLIEYDNGKYKKSGDALTYGVLDYDKGTPLPSDYEDLRRYYKGNFLIVMKHSAYNLADNTYDARHANVTHSEFKEQLEKIVTLEHDLLACGCSRECAKKCAVKKLNKDSSSMVESVDYEMDFGINDNAVKQLVLELNFEDIIKRIAKKSGGTTNLKYHYVSYVEYNWLEIIPENLIKNNFILCKDGKIRKNGIPFYVNSRAMAQELEKEVNQRIQEKAYERGMKITVSLGTIHITKNGEPKHRFTLEEVRKVMRDADDRDANQLVIDENGYARIVVNNEYSGSTFPISVEQWGPRTVNVGKYADLSDLGSLYKKLLETWEGYLNQGVHFYIDEY